jgi:cyclic pyranopterin monophosphate synthase
VEDISMPAKRISPDKKLTHVSSDGSARMVDVGGKRATRRVAVAEAWVGLNAETAERLRLHGAATKGNVLETARIAGIMAAKKTAELIPMCHPIGLEVVEMEAHLKGQQVHLISTAATSGRTGVEMEALTAVSVAALTVYDMLKAIEKGIEIGPIRLIEKRGGKSGHWKRKEIAHGSS